MVGDIYVAENHYVLELLCGRKYFAEIRFVEKRLLLRKHSVKKTFCEETQSSLDANS